MPDSLALETSPVQVVTNDITTILLNYIHSEFPVLPSNGQISPEQLANLESFIKSNQKSITSRPIISSILWKYGWNGHHFYTDDEQLNIRKLVDSLSTAHLKSYRFKEAPSSPSGRSPARLGSDSYRGPSSPDSPMKMAGGDGGSILMRSESHEQSTYKHTFRTINMYNARQISVLEACAAANATAESEGRSACDIDEARLDNLTIQSYCPDILLDTFKRLSSPTATQFYGACLLIDISGFTNLSNMFCERGSAGLDELHMATNDFLGYFADSIYQFGGDVIAFAGDALVCVFRDTESEKSPYSPVYHNNSNNNLTNASNNINNSSYNSTIMNMLGGSSWKSNNNNNNNNSNSPPTNGMSSSKLTPGGGGGSSTGGSFGGTSVKGIVDFSAANMRALQCAWLLKDHSNEQLSVHIGISCGEMAFALLGGYKGKWTFILNGACIPELSACIDAAKSKEVVITGALYDMVQKYIDRSGTSVEVLENGNIKLLTFKSKLEYNPVGERFADAAKDDTKERTNLAKVFVAAPVIDAINLGQYHTFMSEVREVTTMFIKLDSYSSLLHRNPISLQTFYYMVQKCLHETGGFMRQFLIDDKGCVLIAMWGVPSFSYGNNCSRAVNCSRKVTTRGKALNHQVSIGITTGNVFCGNVGSESRHDYVGIGHTVNLAARFMGKAHGRTLMDIDTYKCLQLAEKAHIKEGDHLRLKGVADLVPSFMVNQFAEGSASPKEITIRDTKTAPEDINEYITDSILTQLLLMDAVDRQFIINDVVKTDDFMAAECVIPAAGSVLSVTSEGIGESALNTSASGLFNGNSVAGSANLYGSPRPARKAKGQFKPKIHLGNQAEAADMVNLKTMPVSAFFKQYINNMGSVTSAIDLMRSYTNEAVFANSGRNPDDGLSNVTCTILESSGGKAETVVPRFFLKNAWDTCTRCVTVACRLVDSSVPYGAIKKTFIRLIGMENCVTEAQQKHVFSRLLRTAYAHNSNYDDSDAVCYRDHMWMINAWFDFNWKEQFAPAKHTVDIDSDLDYFFKSPHLRDLMLTLIGVILVQKPSAIVFENAHFMDALSLQFLLQVLNLPVCCAILMPVRVPPPKVSSDLLLTLRGNNPGGMHAAANRRSHNRAADQILLKQGSNNSVLSALNTPNGSIRSTNGPSSSYGGPFDLQSPPLSAAASAMLSAADHRNNTINDKSNKYLNTPPGGGGISKQFSIAKMTRQISAVALSLFGINRSAPVSIDDGVETEEQSAVGGFGSPTTMDGSVINSAGIASSGSGGTSSVAGGLFSLKGGGGKPPLEREESTFARLKGEKSTVNINTLRKSSLLKAYQDILRHKCTTLLTVENMTKDELLIFLKKGLKRTQIYQGIIDIVYELSNGNWYWCNNLLKFIQQRGTEEFFHQMSEEGAQKRTLALLTICGFDSLRPHEKMLMKAAAVIGEEFYRDMLDPVLPLSFRNHIDDLLESLVASGLLLCVDHHPPCYAFPSGQIAQILHDVMPRSEAMHFHEAVAKHMIESKEHDKDLKYASLSYHLGFCPDRKSDAFKYDILAADETFSIAGFRQEVLDFIQEAAKHATNCHEYECLLIIVEYFVHELALYKETNVVGPAGIAGGTLSVRGGGFKTAAGANKGGGTLSNLLTNISGKMMSGKMRSPQELSPLGYGYDSLNELGLGAYMHTADVDIFLAEYTQIAKTIGVIVHNTPESTKNNTPRLLWRPVRLFCLIGRAVADHATALERRENNKRKFSVLSYMGLEKDDPVLYQPVISIDIHAPFATNLRQKKIPVQTADVLGAMFSSSGKSSNDSAAAIKSADGTAVDKILGTSSGDITGGTVGGVSAGGGAGGDGSAGGGVNANSADDAIRV